MRLVLGVVGAVIGSYFGQPALGYAIGSAIGGAVDPEVIKSTGPRLEDLRVQASTYGGMIPVVYGTQRVAGNVLWASPMRETVTTTENDGKGGPVSETTTYSYSIDLAIGICEGEIAGIRKIWANGTLIYNIGDDADGITLAASAIGIADSLTVYTGTETQLADPTIEAIEGAGNVPGYRGLAYVVIADAQLANYGNRIPNIEFEVIASGTTEVVGTSWVQNASFPEIFNPAFGDDPYASPQMATDGNILFALVANVGSAVPKVITTRDLTTWSSVTPTGLSDRLDWGKSSLVVFEGAFYRIGDEDGFAQPTGGVYRSLDEGATWEICGTLPYDGADGFFAYTRACTHEGAIYVVGGKNVSGTNGATVWKSINGTDWEVICPSGTANSPEAGYSGAIVSLDGDLYVWRNTTKVYKSTDDGVTWSLLAAGSTANDVATGFVFNGELYSVTQTTDPEIETSADGITWVSVSGSPTLTGYHQNVVPFGASIVLADWIDPAVANTPNFDEQIKLYMSAGRIVRQAAGLDDIVSDLCVRAGLTAGQINVTALTDNVWGYTLTRPAAARGNLLPLQKAYQFDAVESDGKIKFVKRGGASAVTITVDDLGAYEDGGNPIDPLQIRRQQEAEMPLVVSVNFPNIDNAYQVASESCRRLLSLGEQQVSEDIPLPLTAEEGAQLAEILMYDAHIGRSSFSFSTTRKYAKYEPTDVVTVNNSVASYEMRLVKKDESGPLIKWEGIATAAAVYTSSAPGTTTVVSDPQIGVPGVTYYYLIDCPLLRDEDDGPGFYAVLAKQLSGWTGATLYKSSDNVAYSAVGSVANTGTFGICAAALGDFTGGNTVDEKNTVEVIVAGGTLASITYAQLLNEGNAAIIGRELIHFRTATLLSAGRYRLSGLLRGRRGTEAYIGTHTSSDSFALLAVPGMLRVGNTLAELGVQLYYKAVSNGNTIAVSPFGTLTNTGKGLLPLSPVHIGGGKQSNGDFIITWVRRTRLDGGWRPLVDVPLGETSESYRVYVYDGATLVRTITATSETATYTAAQQTTDFGGEVAAGDLTITVCQVSASIGAGTVTAATL